MTFEKKPFGENLQRIMDERGIERRPLARALDYSEGTIDNWCLGSNLPTPDRAVVLAEHLGVSVDELIPPEWREGASSPTGESVAVRAAEDARDAALRKARPGGRKARRPRKGGQGQ